ncbi:MAG: ATP-binding protein [Phycisphaerae bacterium]|nr:ATP-binding protein [Phycisphaerae bacterium]
MMHRAKDVFTPTTPARLAFVERESVNDQLVDALQTPGTQIVVYGHSGSGKTTLLVNKLHQLYENHVTSRCLEGITIDQLLLDAFDQLDRFYVSGCSASTTEQISASLQQQFCSLKLILDVSRGKQAGVSSQRVLPPQLTPQRLAQFMGEVRACWLLEDFHKVHECEKRRLAQMMKVFADTAYDYPELRIVAIGAVGTAREVVEHDPNMRERIAEVEVPLMNDKEVLLIMQKGEQLLNIGINSQSKESIVRFANGLPSPCHRLCLNLCRTAGVLRTCDSRTTIERDIFRESIRQYLRQCSDSLRGAFDKALRQRRESKYKNTELILKALSELSPMGARRGEIHARIMEDIPDYPLHNLTRYLKQLQRQNRAALLYYDSGSGRYSFAEPFFRAYAQVMFEERQTKAQPRTLGKNASLREVLEYELPDENPDEIIEIMRAFQGTSA